MNRLAILGTHSVYKALISTWSPTWYMDHYLVHGPLFGTVHGEFFGIWNEFGAWSIITYTEHIWCMEHYLVHETLFGTRSIPSAWGIGTWSMLHVGPWNMLNTWEHVSYRSVLVYVIGHLGGGLL